MTAGELVCQPGAARLIRAYTRKVDNTPAAPSVQTFTWFKTGAATQTLAPTLVATGTYTVNLAGLAAQYGDVGDLVHAATVDGVSGEAVLARLRFAGAGDALWSAATVANPSPQAYDFKFSAATRPAFSVAGRLARVGGAWGRVSTHNVATGEFGLPAGHGLDPAGSAYAVEVRDFPAVQHGEVVDAGALTLSELNGALDARGFSTLRLVRWDHDYGGTDNWRFIDQATGLPLAQKEVFFFLDAEYHGGVRRPVGATVTDAQGRSPDGLWLYPLQYAVVVNGGLGPQVYPLSIVPTP